MAGREIIESQGKRSCSWESSSFLGCLVGFVPQASCFSLRLNRWSKVTPECRLVIDG